MKYSIVIPTYNHCEDLLKPCLESIFKYTNMADVELIISANGCIDNTRTYLSYLSYQFESLGFSDHFKIVWSDAPTGFAKATNAGIKAATTNKIILLNNDIVLLEQSKSNWLDLLQTPFNSNSKCGISCIVKQNCDAINMLFAVFFCVMIDRKVFEKIGLLNEEYGKGSGEDVEFSIEAERAGFDVCECLNKQWGSSQWVGGFPIWHKGEGTVHDKSLVPDWNDVFLRNHLKLAAKYNEK